VRRRNRGIRDIYLRSTGVSLGKRTPTYALQEDVSSVSPVFREVAELFWFGFQVVVLLVGKHEIQEDETGLDELTECRRRLRDVFLPISP